MKNITVLNFTSTIILVIFILTGCNSGNKEVNKPNGAIDALTSKPIGQSSELKKNENGNTSKSINLNEDILFSFKTKNDDKVLSINISKVNDYIVYRFGKKDKIELEYPDNLKDSWDKFIYSDYHRGGGQQNFAMDLNYLSFNNGNFIYKVFDEYTSNERNIGVRITDISNNKSFEIEGDSQNVTGGLMFLDKRYPKIEKALNDLEQINGK